MYKLFLLVFAIIGIRYGLPLLWDGSHHMVCSHAYIEGRPIVWVDIFTIIAIISFCNVKSK
jgi:hypothetical protein